mgnify:CR=1 FL=1
MTKKILIWVLIIVIIVIGVIAGYFFQNMLKFKEQRQEQEVPPVSLPSEEGIFLPAGEFRETRPEAVKMVEDLGEREKIVSDIVCKKEEFKDPRGKIYLSLQNIDEQTVGIYEFDVKMKVLNEYLKKEGCNNLTVSFSLDKRYITFVSDCEENRETIAIARSDKSESKFLKLSLTGDGFFSRPIFSPNGKEIAFTFIPSVSDILAESGRTYIFDLEGKEKFSTAGTMPIFSPDGKYLLVLKNPGIYKINLETGEVERVVELRDVNNQLILGRLNMMISLSQDGKKLSLSNVERNEIYVFEIESWEPFNYKLIAQLKANGFWNQFSPDGKYLVLQESDLTSEGFPINPRISVIETCTFERLFSFDLKSYNPTAMWVTDWQY